MQRSPKTPMGFNDGMDVIKLLQGVGSRVYVPRISCGAIEIEALWASQMQALLLYRIHVA